MEVKGANPFLFTEDDYVSPSSANSNPFLMGDEDDFMGSAGNDNPFLSQSAATMAPAAQTTNPFAFDPMDLEPPEAQAANFPENNSFLIDANVSIIPQKPTDLDLKFTHTVASDFDNAGPKRPPPPRPPPSKETQDLLMSVMGEMDAASSHLLDRIPPTRTPSPVSMRDLHSPSPTPEPQFGDLLDVSDAKTDTGARQERVEQNDDLFMLDDEDSCDINKNQPVSDDLMQQQAPMIPQKQQPPIVPQQPIMQQPPIVPQQPVMQQQKVAQPPRPAPPVRPPPPQKPQKPPPPNFAQPPPKPPPPVQKPQPKPEDEFMDMFGAQQPQAPKSKADIMNLYNTKQETTLDLLSDSLDTPMPTSDASISESNSRKSSVPSTDNTISNPNAQISTSPQNLQDNFLSPQQDMQMDTSDSQSKESVSSVTFNPFAAVEETSPTNPIAIPTQDFSSSIDNGVFHDEIPEDVQKVEDEGDNIFAGNNENQFPQTGEVNNEKTTISGIFGINNDQTYTNQENIVETTNTDDGFGLMNTDVSYSSTNIFTTADTSLNQNQNIFTTAESTEAMLSNQNKNVFTTAEQDSFGVYTTSAYGEVENKNIFETTTASSNANIFGTTEEPTNIFTTSEDNYETKTSSNIFGASDDAFVTTTTNSSNIFGTSEISYGTTQDSYVTTTAGESNIFGTAPCNTTNIFGTTQDSFGTETTNSNIFGTTHETTTVTTSSNIFGSTQDAFASTTPMTTSTSGMFGTTHESDDFDAFAAKFESVKDEKNGNFDAFGGGGGGGGDTWGGESEGFNESGFGGDEGFDAFLAMKEPPAVPQSTPSRLNKAGSLDSDEEKDFSVVIRPKTDDGGFGGALPVLAPPPVPTSVAYSDSSRINPFDQSEFAAPAVAEQEFALPMGGEMKRTDSQETPPTPLFDDDVSQPLEPFPRVDFTGDGWEMHLRQPNKKKITGQRFWKKIFVRLVYQQDCVLLQLYNQASDKDPFQELPLQPCYSVSEIGAQQYDNFGKIFTVKLQYIFYKERPGVRPGQVKKAERITNKLSQFAAYAIQGDYQGCKEFGSDLKKLGLPVEHAPQVSQLMKIGSLNFEDLKQFSVTIEEALFKLQAHRDRALHYKMEEVQVTAVDELYVEQDADGHIEKQIARVRLFFLGFLTGMPDIELGVNDMRRQGKEVVGRHDIIPVVTEEWIRLENVEFHSCVQQDEYNDTHIIKFKPPDACYIELLRFRVRPPKNRELPLQLKAQICVTGNKVELRADVLVPGFASRKLGQVPCEDVMIRFPIPECWIYMFRVEKHFRYGSVKSAHRRTGKIKGIERILGTVDTLQESLIEVTSGQAKYEHQHRAIVWRCPRLPKEGQGAYTTHNMVCKLSLTGYDQMPDQLAEYAYVEFTMPATQVSHTTVRSVSLQNSDSDEPPEKYVRYLARHEYRVGIEHTEGEGPSAYAAATQVKPKPVPEEKPAPIPEAESSSDSD